MKYRPPPTPATPSTSAASASCLLPPRRRRVPAATRLRILAPGRLNPWCCATRGQQSSQPTSQTHACCSGGSSSAGHARSMAQDKRRRRLRNHQKHTAARYSDFMYVQQLLATVNWHDDDALALFLSDFILRTAESCRREQCGAIFATWQEVKSTHHDSGNLTLSEPCACARRRGKCTTSFLWQQSSAVLR